MELLCRRLPDYISERSTANPGDRPTDSSIREMIEGLAKDGGLSEDSAGRLLERITSGSQNVLTPLAARKTCATPRAPAEQPGKAVETGEDSPAQIRKT